MAIRKTKIVCTLGPASDSEEVIRELMLGGMNVARMNFSHGTHESHLKTLNIVKKVREELDLPVAALLDTKGPEIRLRTFKGGRITLEPGQTFTLTSDEIEGTNERASITYKGLPSDVSQGTTILIDDGLIEMKVTDVTDTDIICRVVNGGEVSDHKGVNVPDCRLSMPFISDQDYSDLVFGVENGYDFIAASFTRTAQDILDMRRVLAQHGDDSIRIIAKIENREGIDNIDDIIRVSDGIMVARGDMGVEIPFEEVPILQKMIIKKCYQAGKIAITATQMLESMIENPRPTRAEVTDVANAVYDNTSAVMLSGETAAGRYPVEAVKTMARIAQMAEEAIDYGKMLHDYQSAPDTDITNAISHACCTTAEDLNASAIVTVTKSGFTARMLSKYRPVSPIIACAMAQDVRRKLNLSWGVIPILIGKEDSTDKLFDCAVDSAQKAGLVKQGEVVVITAGVPLSVSGTTNILKVHVVGHVLIKGRGYGGKASGNLCVCSNESSLKRIYKQGDIVVISHTSNGIMEQLRTASAIITEEEGEDSHAAVVGSALSIPVITGAKNAVQILKQGTYVTVDADKGMVIANNK